MQRLRVKNVSPKLKKLKYRLPTTKFFSLAYPEVITLSPGTVQVSVRLSPSLMNTRWVSRFCPARSHHGCPRHPGGDPNYVGSPIPTSSSFIRGKRLNSDSRRRHLSSFPQKSCIYQACLSTTQPFTHSYREQSISVNHSYTPRIRKLMWSSGQCRARSTMTSSCSRFWTAPTQAVSTCLSELSFRLCRYGTATQRESLRP